MIPENNKIEPHGHRPWYPCITRLLLDLSRLRRDFIRAYWPLVMNCFIVPHAETKFRSSGTESGSKSFPYSSTGIARDVLRRRKKTTRKISTECISMGIDNYIPAVKKQSQMSIHRCQLSIGILQITIQQNHHDRGLHRPMRSS